MPFKSKAQMRSAFAGFLGQTMKKKAPQWAKETKSIKRLPEHVKRVSKNKKKKK